MNVSLFIAKRYLFAKKSHNLVNVITMVSLLGVFVGSAALIIVLSVFNGFEGLVTKLYNSFDPALKITLNEGKFFDADSTFICNIQHTPGVKAVALSLEENALIKYKDKQFIATLKGVDAKFSTMANVHNMMIAGEYMLQPTDSEYYAVVGQTIATQLGLQLGDALNPLQVYVPKAGKQMELNPEDSFNKAVVYAAGVYSIQQEIDAKYVLVPLQFIENLINKTNKLTSVEISLVNDKDEAQVKHALQAMCGTKYSVKTRFEQHEFLYKIMKSEKWAIFMILTFILLIAAFNIIGSLTMLIVDKKKDITVLTYLGASKKLIQQIFVTEGLLISLGGAIAGVTIGLLVCVAQLQFGLLKLGTDDSFIIQYYPVAIQWLDVLYVLITVLVIGYVAAAWPVRKVLNGF
jgi:lipoprotein-releasing system permease protein